NPKCPQTPCHELVAVNFAHPALPLLRSVRMVVSRRTGSKDHIHNLLCGERKVDRARRIVNQLRTAKFMTLNIRPIGDRILVEAVEEKEVSKGGIVIPDTAKEKPMESRVVALGTGKTDDNGKKVPFEMKKGDRLLVTRYGGTEVKLEGREYKILSSDDVLAVLE